MRFNVGERVRIIDKRNEYYNHTGIIIKIDFCVYHTVALDLDTIGYGCFYPGQLAFVNGDLVNDTITCNLTGNYISLLDRLPTNPRKEEKRKIFPNTPKSVLFNDKKKATTLIFDNKVVVVKAREDDKYDRRIGFLEAYFQATSRLSKTKALKYLNDIVKDKPKKKPKHHNEKEVK